MSNIFNLENFTDFSEKINIDELYEKKKQSDLQKLDGEEDQEELNENYSRFKKETVTRSKAQQMHEAAKVIEKKLKEVNRLLEYSAQLREELSEGDDFQYNHHTSKVVERITMRIAEAYTKSKKLK